jgi:hypothetical protein
MKVDEFDNLVNDMGEDLKSVDCEKILSKGKNARSEIIAYGYRFDSKEELDVFEWILEAKELGFIDEYEYQPKSFELFGGVKNQRGKYIVRPHVYTADFKILFNDKWIEFRKENKLKVFDKFDEKTVYIDVKGSWSKYDDGRSFAINFKWTLSKFGIHVWKIVPLKFFEKTWLPKKCVLTRKTHKVSAKYSKLLTFENKKFASK